MVSSCSVGLFYAEIWQQIWIVVKRLVSLVAMYVKNERARTKKLILCTHLIATTGYF